MGDRIPLRFLLERLFIDYSLRNRYESITYDLPHEHNLSGWQCWVLRRVNWVNCVMKLISFFLFTYIIMYWLHYFLLIERYVTTSSILIGVMLCHTWGYTFLPLENSCRFINNATYLAGNSLMRLYVLLGHHSLQVCM